MHKLLPWISACLALFVVSCSAARADEVGTSKSFAGRVGLQLYSLRDLQKAQGVGATLDQAKRWGFKYVEVASLGGLTAAEFKAELDRRGLVAIGSHFPYERLRDDVEGVARDAKALGMPYAGCAWLPHKAPFDEKQCREVAAVLNRAGAALARHGIKFYLHNHGYEFQPFGEGTLFDLLMAETDPQTVFFQMDVLWVVLPGQDPVKLLEKHPRRWLLMHLKDLRKGGPLGSLSGSTDLTNDVALGTGQVDFPTLLRTAQRIGVEYYFIEDESPTAIEQIPRSLRFLESVEW
ncbi:MAG: sugar phosphate isomerase/epimerase [Planctomycetota bacterium]|nr:sugar phosphate isomerase/epimerase [Planctomycetota bacterium]